MGNREVQSKGIPNPPKDQKIGNSRRFSEGIINVFTIPSLNETYTRSPT